MPLHLITHRTQLSYHTHHTINIENIIACHANWAQLGIHTKTVWLQYRGKTGARGGPSPHAPAAAPRRRGPVRCW